MSILRWEKGLSIPRAEHLASLYRLGKRIGVDFKFFEMEVIREPNVRSREVRFLDFNYKAIRRLREYLRLSRQDFAQEVNTTAMTVLRWEKGLSRPRANSIVRMYAIGKEVGVVPSFFGWEHLCELEKIRSGRSRGMLLQLPRKMTYSTHDIMHSPAEKTLKMLRKIIRGEMMIPIDEGPSNPEQGC